jgi:hypothetical protein
MELTFHQRRTQRTWGKKAEIRKQKTEIWGKKLPLTVACLNALRFLLSAFCFPNFSFSARPPAPSPPKT